jgi:NTE family protein
MTAVTLALGGGGSKGYAHLGVIRALLKSGFEIKAIAGTSAGGMAAAVFAAGYSPDEIIDKVADMSQDDLYGFGRGPSLLGTKGIQSILAQFLEGITFSDLQIPCALTAVDLVEMTEVVLDEGNVLDAVMATTAIPGIFPPKEIYDYVLVDGMVLNPVPVELARSLAPKLPVVAVSLTPEPERWKIVSPWDSTPANPLLRPISRLRVAKAFDVYLRSMDITLHMLGEIRLQVEKPEVLIRPDVSHIGSLDRVDVREVAELGDKAVSEALPDIKGLIKKKKRWFRRKKD